MEEVEEVEVVEEVEEVGTCMHFSQLSGFIASDSFGL